MVLGAGKLLERGPPLELLADSAGVLHGLVTALGEAAAAELRARAKAATRDRQSGSSGL